jgi:hypothetical protein
MMNDWRFIVLFHPFQTTIPFYAISGDDVKLRRAAPWRRQLPVVSELGRSAGL